MGTASLLSATVLADKNIILVRDLYGSIPNNFFKPATNSTYPKVASKVFWTRVK